MHGETVEPGACQPVPRCVCIEQRGTRRLIGLCPEHGLSNERVPTEPGLLPGGRRRGSHRAHGDAGPGRTGWSLITRACPSCDRGGFSIEQRYRFDRESNQTSLLSEKEAQALLRQGHGDQLKGTVRPDIVIHTGNPLQAQAVYDLKFPCPGRNEAKWNEYPEVYKRALRVAPVRVAPGWGLVP